MSDDRFDKLAELLGDFDRAMLVTRAASGELRSRPMAIADCTDTARLWFMTSNKSGKLEELDEHPEVNVALQDGHNYVSISGTARVTRDRARIEQLWSSVHNAWFEGPDDPSLVLLEIVPTTAEYWDNSGIEGIKFLWRAARAALTDEPLGLENETDMHGKVQFPERQLDA